MRPSLAILFFLFLSSGAHGFTLVKGGSGQAATGWPSSDVVFDLDTTCTPYLTTVRAAIDAAANTWGAVPNSSLKISMGSTVTLPQPITTYVGSGATSYAPIGNPIVYCDTNFGANSGADANSTPGFATTPNMNSAGQILGVLLVLNFQSGATSSLLTASPTIANVVLTHEIGHCLGIGHSAEFDALMYFQTRAGRQMVLAKDDTDAVSYLYPKQEVNGGLGCATVRNRHSPQGPFSSGFHFVLEILLLAVGFFAIIKMKKGGIHAS